MNTTTTRLIQNLKDFLTRQSTFWIFHNYRKKFKRYSFIDCKCESYEQFRASIIRLYHTIEKGLSYENYRAGFGMNNINNLIISLEQYSAKGYDTTAFFYETALSCLNKYIEKNKEFGFTDDKIENRVKRLKGKPNDFGGSITVSAPVSPNLLNFEQIMKSRHSIRHFSSESVNVETLKEAILLAQYTPSACNRQGWKTRIIESKEKISIILANQNGNRGFGQEIDKILLVTADVRAQQKNREMFQAFIDGGMYAESLLNALFSLGLASVPLSASLTPRQERNIRNELAIDDAEVFILIIGVGKYPLNSILTTRSQRETAEIEII